MNDDFLNHDQLRHVRGKSSGRERMDARTRCYTELWIAGATLAVTAASAGYSAYSSSKSASGAPTAPKFHKAEYTPLDPNSLQTTSPESANALAEQYDRQYYGNSDADFAQRHPELVKANRIAEQNALAQQQGQLPAGLAAELTRAGLSSGSTALSGSIVPGSSGAYGVARGLGVGYLDYMNNANQTLANLDAANPQRTFGLNGNQALGQQLNNQQQTNSVLVSNNEGLNQVAVANSTGQNSSSQGGFAGALQSYANQQANNRALVNTVATTGTQLLGQYAAQHPTTTYTATPNWSGIYGIG